MIGWCFVESINWFAMVTISIISFLISALVVYSQKLKKKHNARHVNLFIRDSCKLTNQYELHFSWRFDRTATMTALCCENVIGSAFPLSQNAFLCHFDEKNDVNNTRPLYPGRLSQKYCLRFIWMASSKWHMMCVRFSDVCWIQAAQALKLFKDHNS